MVAVAVVVARSAATADADSVAVAAVPGLDAGALVASLGIPRLLIALDGTAASR